jgi:hypothetical protein
MTPCPQCGSARTRRGGKTVWIAYLVIIAVTVPATLVWRLNAAVMAGVLILAALAVNLLIGERFCPECGHQWRSG